MQTTDLLWVLGHRIRRLETDATYALIEVTSPARASGPPPHYHKNEREFFMVLKGALDVMHGGQWQTMTAGSFAELAPGAVHTFANNTDEDTVWITGWRPKGFYRFFSEFGIPVDEAGARERSVSDDVVRRVLESCERFGMYVAP